jgi:hypothetical protein
MKEKRRATQLVLANDRKRQAKLNGNQIVTGSSQTLR